MSAPEVLGRLSRVRRIGVGGFASVWLYHDTKLKSHVAVKILADNWAQHADVRERFLTEAQLLRATDSAHVVQVHDLGELTDRAPYFVMGYADQGTVADLLRERAPELATTVDLITQAAQGIADLHATGVIHRDIKPSNLLLRSDRTRGKRLLVADLGVAKAMMFASGMTQIVGTPAYMAPEQSEPGTPVDGRADVHALGAVAYHLLTGEVIREGSLYGRVDAAVPDAPSVVADVPDALDDVVLRAITVDPAERWPDPVSFAAALQDTAESIEPYSWKSADTPKIHVTPPNGTRTPPLRRRSRKAWLVTGLVAALVAAVAIGGYVVRPWDETTAGSPSASDDYCTVLQDDWDHIASIGTTGLTFDDYAAITDAVHRIRVAAPDDIEQRWAAVDDPLQDFRSVIERAGTTWEALKANEVDTADRGQVYNAVNRLSERLNTIDFNAIATIDARDRCGFAPRRVDTR